MTPRDVTSEQLDNWFAYHPPRDAAAVDAHERVRAAARAMAEVFRLYLPDGPDKTAALLAVRQAMWAGNAAIACHVPPVTRGGAS